MFQCKSMEILVYFDSENTRLQRTSMTKLPFILQLQLMNVSFPSILRGSFKNIKQYCVVIFCRIKRRLCAYYGKQINTLNDTG
jgi:hypothetical protein